MPASPPLHRWLSGGAQAVGVTLVGCLPLLPPLLSSGLNHPPLFWPRHLLLLAFLVGVFYLNRHLVVPKLLFRQRAGAYILAVATILMSVWALANFLVFRQRAGPGQPLETGFWRMPAPENRLTPRRAHTAAPAPPPALRTQERRNAATFELIVLLSTGLMIGLGTLVAFTQRRQTETELRHELEAEKLNVELSYLKAQLNPHFFFNTLNNIYALTEIDVAKAQRALYQLSRIMRYVLYQTQASQVLLSQEIQFMQDYVSLMQLRLTPNMRVEFAVPTPLDDRPIAPLLLLPFLENAFKYGVHTAQPAVIAIALTQTAGTLCVMVHNQVFAPHRTGLADAASDTQRGIGLTNTRRRLELLYAGRYELLLDERPAPAATSTAAAPATGPTFAVRLSLQLA